jgi:hypothetical protein
MDMMHLVDASGFDRRGQAAAASLSWSRAALSALVHQTN